MSEEKIQEVKANPANKMGIQKDKWKRDINEKLRQVEAGSEDLSIFKVPNKLRKVKDEAYSPRVVSIGPFHRGKQELVAMREHKWRYMLQFSQRLEDPQQNKSFWEKCTNSVYDLDAKVRASYAEKLPHIDELAEIMLLDGCFILELFLRYDQHLTKKLNDALYNNAWMIPDIRHDLALLENQIPFFVLKMLYDAAVIMPNVDIIDGKPPKSITSLALQFFQMKQKPITTEKPDKECKHLLDLLHKYYISGSGSELLKNQISIKVSRDLVPGNQPATASNDIRGFKFCAAELLEAGIDFKKGSTDDNLLKISFENGVMRMPELVIEETTFSLFRNLIAFEQCSLSSRHHITSYAILMQSLIRSPRDIIILKRKEIIDCKWMRLKECLGEFRSIKDQVVVKDVSFGELCKEVNDYLKNRHLWKKYKVYWRAKFEKHAKAFHHRYFETPWSIISFIAAVALFVLTIIQTHYAIHPAR